MAQVFRLQFVKVSSGSRAVARLADYTGSVLKLIDQRPVAFSLWFLVFVYDLRSGIDVLLSIDKGFHTWSVADSFWSVVCGLRYMVFVNSLRSLVCGLTSIVSGLWS